jgi:hypothetical protein
MFAEVVNRLCFDWNNRHPQQRIAPMLVISTNRLKYIPSLYTNRPTSKKRKNPNDAHHAAAVRVFAHEWSQFKYEWRLPGLNRAAVNLLHKKAREIVEKAVQKTGVEFGIDDKPQVRVAFVWLKHRVWLLLLYIAKTIFVLFYILTL